MNTTIQGVIQIISCKSLNEFKKTLIPLRTLLATDIDDEIREPKDGQPVKTYRITSSGSNDLTNGWENAPLSSSSVNVTLEKFGHDVSLTELQYSQMTPKEIEDIYATLARQTAKDINDTIGDDAERTVFVNRYHAISPAPMLYSSTWIEEETRICAECILAYDASQPGWKLGFYILAGIAKV